MAEPISIAKAVVTAAKFLLTTDEEGNSGFKKLIIGIVIGAFGFLLLLYVAIEIYLTPISGLAEFFLPESIQEALDSINATFDRPTVSTGREGIVPFPVTISTVSSYYGPRNIPGMPDRSFHEGIDFPVAFGSEVMAIAPGKVVDTGVSADYGHYVMIKHIMIRLDANGDEIERETFYSFYAHLYRVYVFEGQTVELRRQIALSGGDPTLHFAGNSTGPHLHLELRRTMEYSSHFNPYAYVLDPNPFDGETKSVRWAAVT